MNSGFQAAFPNESIPVNTALLGRCLPATDAGIEGLVHVSEMDWTNKNVHPSKVVALGDEVVADDRPAGGQQSLGNVIANESGGTGHQYRFGRRLLLDKCHDNSTF